MAPAERERAAGLWRLANVLSAEHWPLLCMGLIVGLAVAVRVADVASSDLSYDEAYSWYVASAPSAAVFLHRLAASENTPPLFYLILSMMPAGVAGLRLASVVCGVGMCVVVFLLMRVRARPLAALLASLVVAVDPFLVSDSDLARGFMLADLALLIVLWMVLALGERETSSRWVVLVSASAVAVWSEYSSLVVLVALFVAAALVGRPDRRKLLVRGTLGLLALGPWIPEIIRGQSQVGVTKFDPVGAEPSLSAMRDVIVTLAFGERGGTADAAARWALACAFCIVAVIAWVALHRRWSAIVEPERRMLLTVVGTLALSLIGYALLAPFGIQIFNQRYMTVFVALVAILAACSLVGAGGRRRPLIAAAFTALAALGVGNAVRRAGGQFQPDLAPVRAAAVALHPAMVLTNTPTVLYYLRSLHPILDRPSNSRPGRHRALSAAMPGD